MHVGKRIAEDSDSYALILAIVVLGMIHLCSLAPSTLVGTSLFCFVRFTQQ
jgi:hypothetical protein